jgi:threonine synthase
VTRKLYEQGRISPNEVTVACITGNGLKTTDALRGAYETPEPIPAKIVEFENFWQRTLSEHPEIQEPVEA